MTFKPIFKNPAGESEHGWNNMKLSTTREVICELCGTVHPERDPEDDSYVLGTFLGMQFVEQCCGKAIDRVFIEFGEEFALTFLEEFAQNPTGTQYSFLRFRLPEIFSEARANLTKADEAIAQAEKDLPGVKG